MYGGLRSAFNSGGTVSVDARRCIGCGLCVRSCPNKRVLALTPPQYRKRIATVARPDLCVGCGWCTTICPKGALSVVHLWLS